MSDEKVAPGDLTRVAEKLKMRCRNENVCFRIQSKEERHFESSIIQLSEGAKEQLYEDRGVILAVGPGRLNPKTGERVPIDIEVGDVVLFLPHGGLPWREDDAEGFIVPEQNIKAVVRKALVEH